MGSVGTGKSGSRFLNRKWPVEDGITAGTTTQEGHKESLEAETSLITEEERKGL